MDWHTFILHEHWSDSYKLCAHGQRLHNTIKLQKKYQIIVDYILMLKKMEIKHLSISLYFFSYCKPSKLEEEEQITLYTFDNNKIYIFWIFLAFYY